MHPCMQQSRPAVSSSALGRASPAGQGKWSLPSPQPWWDPAGGLGPVLRSPKKERRRHAGLTLSKDQEDWEGLEHSTYEERLRELAVVSLEKLKGILFILPIPDGGKQKRWSQAVFSGVQWQDDKQWAKIQMQETQFKPKKTSHWESDWTPDQAAQRGCGVSTLADAQNLMVYSTEKHVLSDSGLSRRRWIRLCPRVIANLNHSVMLWLCMLK